MPRDGFSELSYRKIPSSAGVKKPLSPWETARLQKIQADKDQQADTVSDTDSDQPPPLAGKAAKLANLTTEIRHLLDEETRFLKNNRPADAKELHGRKNRLMAEYKDTINQLKVNPKSLGSEKSVQRQYIKKLTDLMRESLKAHARVILRLKAISEGLIKSIGEEVAKKDQPVLAYGNRATVSLSKTIRPTSLALNELI